MKRTRATYFVHQKSQQCTTQCTKPTVNKLFEFMTVCALSLVEKSGSSVFLGQNQRPSEPGI